MKLRSLLAPGRHRIPILLVALLVFVLPGTRLLAQQDETGTHRKAVQKVMPPYPAMARSLKLSGMVRVSAKVAPNGKVISAVVLGGHPLFAQVAVDAVRQFRFEAAPQQTEEIVVFTFQPEQ